MMLPEVLVIVLSNLYNEQRNDFLNCMYVCKDWHVLAQPILWKDIFLGHCSFQSFLDGVTRPAALCRIRSVTTRIKFREFTGQSLETLTNVVFRFSTMPALTSFSCTLLLVGMRAEATGPIRMPLTTILQFLPPTIRYLELNGFWGPHEDPVTPDNHLCKDIARLLPQLTVLRLSDMRLCRQLFDDVRQSCTNLEEISINHRQWMSRCDCETAERTDWAYDADVTIEEVLRSARGLVDRGLLPAVSKFVVVGMMWYGEPSVKTFEIFYKADVLSQVTAAFPCGFFRMNIRDPCWLRYRDMASDKQIDLVGIGTELLDFVEGNPWIKYSNGARLPEYLESVHAVRVADMKEWYAIARGKADELREQQPAAAALFYWENKVRRPLLHVQMNKDFSVPQVMVREKPIEEQQLSLNAAERFEWESSFPYWRNFGFNH